MLTLLLALNTALSAPLGRTIDGEQIAPHGPVALVFWSQDCRSCGARMAELEASGTPMIGINVDAAPAQAGLRAFVSRHHITGPVLSDADGRLQRRFQLEEGIVLLDEGGDIVWRQASTDDAVQALLSAPPSTRESAVAAAQ